MWVWEAFFDHEKIAIFPEAGTLNYRDVNSDTRSVAILIPVKSLFKINEKFENTSHLPTLHV